MGCEASAVFLQGVKPEGERAAHQAGCHQQPELHRLHMLASPDGHSHSVTQELITVFENYHLRCLDSIFIVFLTALLYQSALPNLKSFLY